MAVFANNLGRLREQLVDLLVGLAELGESMVKGVVELLTELLERRATCCEEHFLLATGHCVATRKPAR